MKTYLEILLLLVVPVLLIVLGYVPLNQRGTVLIVVILTTIVIAFLDKLSFKSLGLRLDNVQKAFLPYFVFTFTAVLLLLFLTQVLHKSPLPQWWTYSHLLWAFLPISAVQEFAYRAFCQTKLQKIMKPSNAIVITAILYSGMHILWKDPLILIMTFFAGLAWGYLWYKYPNLYLISISHAILNFLAIYFNFFPWLVTEFFKL